jgi:hypothetical protein
MLIEKEVEEVVTYFKVLAHHLPGKCKGKAVPVLFF